MSHPNQNPIISISIHADIWEKVQHIASFMEYFSPETEFEYKVWPKGTLEPEMPGIPEVEG